jgi:hypothetical protein
MKSTVLRPLKIATIATCIIFSGVSASMNNNKAQVKGFLLPSDTVRYSSTRLGKISLLHGDERGFVVLKGNEEFQVKPECMDRELRDLLNEDLALLLGLMSKVVINGQELTLVKMSPELTSKLVAESKNQTYSSTESNNQTCLRREDAEAIFAQLPVGSYIKVFQYSDGEYGLHLEQRWLGGGAGGAACGFYIGVFIANAIGGTISGIAGLGATIVGGPVLGAAVTAGVWGCIAPTVNGAAMVMGAAGGITLAVATGPV